MQAINWEGIQKNVHGQLAHLNFEKTYIITSGLEKVLGLEDTITSYKLQWMEWPSGKYSPTMAKEFFTSYAAIILHSLPKGKKPLNQAWSTYTRVKGWQVYNSDTSIHKILFGLEFLTSRYTTGFNKRFA